jgi:hypothetical protein
MYNDLQFSILYLPPIISLIPCNTGLKVLIKLLILSRYSATAKVLKSNHVKSFIIWGIMSYRQLKVN